MRLTHNLASLNIYRNYSKTLEKQSSTIEKLSSGYKINNSKEDANNLAKSERMRMQIRGLNIASRNTQDGISMLQTAESGIENMTSVLQRVRELLLIYDNDSNNNQDKEIIKNEIGDLINVYDDICNNTEFNEKPLLNYEKEPIKPNEIETSIGANEGEVIKIKFYNLNSNNVGDIKKLNVLKNELGNTLNGSKSLEVVDKVIDTLVEIRSNYGALENNLANVKYRNDEIKYRIEGSESKIRDVDIAEEALNSARNNILIEAANAMMVQTNKLPQDILRILENIVRR